MLSKKWSIAIVMLVIGSTLLTACAAPTPEVKEVIVTVEVTKIVAGTPEIVVEEKVVTATPAPTPTKCVPKVGSPPLIRAGVLQMAINATIPPYQFIDDEGNVQGMRVDLGNEICRRLCLEPYWINIQWEAVIPGLQGGRWDCINSGMGFREERAEIMELVPYEVQALALNVPLGNPDNISSLEDFAGKVIAVESPGYEETELRALSEKLEDQGLEPIDIRTFETYAEAQQVLKAGQVQAVWTVSASAKYLADRGDFEWIGFDWPGFASVLAFKETDLAQAVADTLNEMRADGTYDEIMEKWGGGKIELWEEFTGTIEVY